MFYMTVLHFFFLLALLYHSVLTLSYCHINAKLHPLSISFYVLELQSVAESNLLQLSQLCVENIHSAASDFAICLALIITVEKCQTADVTLNDNLMISIVVRPKKACCCLTLTQPHSLH